MARACGPSAIDNCLSIAPRTPARSGPRTAASAASGEGTLSAHPREGGEGGGQRLKAQSLTMDGILSNLRANFKNKKGTYAPFHSAHCQRPME